MTDFLLIISVLRTVFVIQTDKTTQWLDHYLRGAGMEVYTEYFSREFYGKSFPEAAEFCFTRLNLLLVAVIQVKRGVTVFMCFVLVKTHDIIVVITNTLYA